ncbi:MAG: hypothetical protein DWI09_12175 [Planctomycetota bacterium]|nr:MAG: hypothetical protein DWI09_12175 [Planctomycetota bacterium]
MGRAHRRQEHRASARRRTLKAEDGGGQRTAPRGRRGPSRPDQPRLHRPSDRRKAGEDARSGRRRLGHHRFLGRPRHRSRPRAAPAHRCRHPRRQPRRRGNAHRNAASTRPLSPGRGLGPPRARVAQLPIRARHRVKTYRAPRQDRVDLPIYTRIMSMLTSSNPVLSDQHLGRVLQMPGAVRTDTATVQGVLAKTGVCTILAVAAGAIGYSIAQTYPPLFMISMIASLVVSLVLFFVMMAKPAAAIVCAPVYSITQGLFLGCLSLMLENMLAARQIAVPGGLALQAFIITGSLMTAMLALHSFNIIRAGPRFQSVIMVMTMGLGIAMLAAFVVSLFGVSLPWLSLSGAFGGGSAAWIGLGINAAILLLASLWLLVDLAQIDEAVAAGAPKAMEWMLAFGLIVTLAWVYLEALKLAFRIAALSVDRK